MEKKTIFLRNCKTNFRNLSFRAFYFSFQNFLKLNKIHFSNHYHFPPITVPVVIVFIIISYLIHRNRFTHSIERVSDKVTDLQKFIYESELNVGINMVPPQKNNSIQRNMMNAGLQGVSVIKNVK